MVVTPLAVPNQIIMPMLPKIIAIQEKMPAKGSLKTFNIKGEFFFRREPLLFSHRKCVISAISDSAEKFSLGQKASLRLELKLSNHSETFQKKIICLFDHVIYLRAK